MSQDQQHRVQQQQEQSPQQQQHHNVYPLEIENESQKQKRRSKNGCMTCKIRKKRCDEIKPVCGDCSRLKRKCTWTTPEMTFEEVKELKRQMELIEEDSKSRKRRKKKDLNEMPLMGETAGVVVKSITLAPAYPNGTTSQTITSSPLSLSPFLSNLENYLDSYSGNNNNNNNNQHSPQIEELSLDTSNTQQPMLYYTPSTNNDLLDNLDSTGLKLYDYFRSKLAPMISIVPQEENLYLKTFLPMAHQDLGVLYAIVAWSGFHSNNNEIGSSYITKSILMLNNSTMDGKIDMNDDSINTKIANFLILCGAEICRGDVSNWSNLLTRCAEIIKLKGGIKNFNDSKTRHWLVSNFAYHDIMTSSIMERGIFFPLEDYNTVINLNKFGLDPLHGLSKPLFQLIGEISNFAMNFNKLLQLTSETLSINSYENRYELLQQINVTLKKIDLEIEKLKPNLKDLYKLSSNDIELQLTLFESFQITLKLHLRQSILKLNPKSLEIQFLCVELLRCLDIVLGTNVESSLVFPLFILGINLSNDKDRKLISFKIDEFNKRYQYGNVARLKHIMEVVWEQNSNGEKCIDWYSIVKELGWELSFA